MKSLLVLLTLVAFSKWGDAFFVPSSPLPTYDYSAKQIGAYGAPPVSISSRSLFSKKSQCPILFSQSSEQGADTSRNALDKKSVSEVFSALQSNLEDGEVGTRGEIYFILQIALILCILFGTVPFVGNILSFVLGPGFVLLGGSVLTIGVVELGTNLTPWPSPPKDGSLVTDGLVFNEIRHPIYAGLIYLMFGLSMVTGSAMRVLLCVLLWYLLDFKSDLEESELVQKFGSGYIEYRDRVQGKFIPSRLTQGIQNTATKIGQNDKTGDE